MTSPRARITLEERVAERGVAIRDCRACPAFVPSDTGMSFGWCKAFRQHVKLYHPPARFYSQCQFKVLSRAARPRPPHR